MFSFFSSYSLKYSHIFSKYRPKSRGTDSARRDDFAYIFVSRIFSYVFICFPNIDRKSSGIDSACRDDSTQIFDFFWTQLYQKIHVVRSLFFFRIRNMSLSLFSFPLIISSLEHAHIEFWCHHWLLRCFLPHMNSCWTYTHMVWSK